MHPLLFNKMVERYFKDKAETRAFLANVLGAKKENGTTYSVEDFMPQEEDEPEGPAERLARKIRLSAMSAGA